MKDYKKFARYFVTFCLMVFACSLSIGNGACAESAFAGGSGTKADPYQIETKEQLDAVRNNVKASYKLMNDIVFSDSDFEEGGAYYNNGQGWKTIGQYNALTGYVDYDNCYSGVFDGNGHKIVNLKQNITTKNSQYPTQGSGLFDGVLGTVKNLTIENADIQVNIAGAKGGIYGILSSNNQGQILGCNTSGNLTVQSNNGGAGGIVGYNIGLVADCTNSADISVLYPTERDKYTLVGGIVSANPGEIACCTNRGDIKVANTSDGYAGGIAGGGQETYYCVNEGTVESSVFAAGITAMGCNFKGYGCYNLGSIKGKYAAGIVSEVDFSFAEQCYNIGDLTGEQVGGIAAKTSSGSLDRIVSTNCYFLNTVDKGFAEEDEWNGMTSIARSDISSKETFAGFDFINLWNMLENGPVLKDTAFDYYKEYYKIYDFNKGKEYEGNFNAGWMKTDYFVDDKIDLAGAFFSGKNVVAIVKGNEELIKSEVDHYATEFETDPVYLDDDTIYFAKEDGSKVFYILLVNPDEIEVSGFDTSTPTTKEQKVSVKYYRFTGTYKINVKERPHVHEEDKGTIVEKADCIHPGRIEYKCNDCGEVVRRETIPALGHKLVRTEAVSATTTKSGNTEYYTCTVCNKYFSDGKGRNEIKKDSWIVPILKESTEESSLVKTEDKISTQKISFKKIKQYKAKNLKKKKTVFSLKAKTTGDGKLTYKVTKGSKKYISVSKSGKVTLRKGCKKGTYKITITACKTKKYKKATKVVIIKVK